MGNLDHLSDDECRAMLESISEGMEGEECEYVHPSGEREEMNLAENVHALLARVAELEAALAGIVRRWRSGAALVDRIPGDPPDAVLRGIKEQLEECASEVEGALRAARGEEATDAG